MLEIKMFLGGRRMEESMIDTKKKSKKGKENMDALWWKPSDKKSPRGDELTMPSTEKISWGYGPGGIH